jgi:oligopeptide transport system ATP-binding protein
MTAFLEVRDLKKQYPGGVRAVDGVSFDLQQGQTLGVVGESGCGKSTLARLLLRLIESTSGAVRLNGEDLLALKPAQLRERRRDMQIVFQDPYASLDPRMSIGDAIAEPLDIHNIGTRAERRAQVLQWLDRVGLPRNAAERYPHEFSGGQRQRIGIARALALRPKLLILDEPVSALDVSIQSQVLNLLTDLKSEFGLTYIFISHDLSVVEHIADHVAVMYLGVIVEQGPSEAVFKSPLHPYTQALISAVPNPDPRIKRQRIILGGDPPNPANVPSGCRFHPRCFKAQAICTSVPPPAFGGVDHPAWCHFAGTST